MGSIHDDLDWERHALQPAQRYIQQCRSNISLELQPTNDEKIGWNMKHPLASALPSMMTQDHDHHELSNSSPQPPCRSLIIVITGGTNGIGLSLVTKLVRLGARVVVIGRSMTKLQQLKESIHNQEGGVGSIDIYRADLQDLAQVSLAAHQILEKYCVIDILLCNAGIHDGFALSPTPLSPQGYDRVFATNFLSHCLLTEILQPALLRAPMPTVVQTSSSFNWGVDGSDLMPSPRPPHFIKNSIDSSNNKIPIAARPGGSTGIFGVSRAQRSYSNSKLAQILYSRAASRRWSILSSQQDKSSTVRFASFCPGWVGSGFAGPKDSILGWILCTFGFSVHGWGTSSALQAMFDIPPNINNTGDGNNKDNVTDALALHDYYVNTSVLAPFQWMFRLTTAWMYQVGIRDVLTFVGSGTAVFIQKFFRPPLAYATNSSPESYNVQLQDAFYDWSYEAIRPYLNSVSKFNKND
jgi:NAD(P)-dependent dehydrogenase (short-subunit alcohol dehydrogenase family)